MTVLTVISAILAIAGPLFKIGVTADIGTTLLHVITNFDVVSQALFGGLKSGDFTSQEGLIEDGFANMQKTYGKDITMDEYKEGMRHNGLIVYDENGKYDPARSEELWEESLNYANDNMDAWGINLSDDGLRAIVNMTSTNGKDFDYSSNKKYLLAKKYFMENGGVCDEQMKFNSMQKEDGLASFRNEIVSSLYDEDSILLDSGKENDALYHMKAGKLHVYDMDGNEILLSDDEKATMIENAFRLANGNGGDTERTGELAASNLVQELDAKMSSMDIDYYTISYDTGSSRETLKWALSDIGTDKTSWFEGGGIDEESIKTRSISVLQDTDIRHIDTTEFTEDELNRLTDNAMKETKARLEAGEINESNFPTEYAEAVIRNIEAEGAVYVTDIDTSSVDNYIDLTASEPGEDATEEEMQAYQEELDNALEEISEADKGVTIDANARRYNALQNQTAQVSETRDIEFQIGNNIDVNEYEINRLAPSYEELLNDMRTLGSVDEDGFHLITDEEINEMIDTAERDARNADYDEALKDLDTQYRSNVEKTSGDVVLYGGPDPYMDPRHEELRNNLFKSNVSNSLIENINSRGLITEAEYNSRNEPEIPVEIPGKDERMNNIRSAINADERNTVKVELLYFGNKTDDGFSPITEEKADEIIDNATKEVENSDLGTIGGTITPEQADKFYESIKRQTSELTTQRDIDKETIEEMQKTTLKDLNKEMNQYISGKEINADNYLKKGGTRDENIKEEIQKIRTEAHDEIKKKLEEDKDKLPGMTYDERKTYMEDLKKMYDEKEKALLDEKGYFLPKDINKDSQSPMSQDAVTADAEKIADGARDAASPLSGMSLSDMAGNLSSDMSNKLHGAASQIMNQAEKTAKENSRQEKNDERA